MGKHKQSHCKICMRTMRSDKLKRHLRVHEKQKEDRYKSESINTDTYQIKKPVLTNKEGLRNILKKHNDEYIEKVALGKDIQEILAEDHFKQESLPPLYKEALDLFIKQRECMDYKDVILKPWQEDLLKHIEIQTDRLIIWVVGRKGGEGKTWFQEFIASRFGWDRVVCGMDIKV